MNVKKKTYTVTYWTCGKDGHRHTTKKIAEKCSKKKREPSLEFCRNRQNEIARRWLEVGIVLRVAKEFSVSVSTASRAVEDRIYAALWLQDNPSYNEYISNTFRIDRHDADKFYRAAKRFNPRLLTNSLYKLFR